MPVKSVNPDETTVDEPIVSPAGPSSPPRRRRRQEDAVIQPVPQDSIANHSIPSPGDATRTDYFPRDVFDDQTGTFPVESGADEAEDEDLGEEVSESSNYRTAQDHMYAGPTDFSFHSRSYDDEDAALQAALKASMDDVPTGWVLPELESKEKVVKKDEPSRVQIRSEQPVTATPPMIQGTGGSKFQENIEDDEEEMQAETLTPGVFIYREDWTALTRCDSQTRSAADGWHVSERIRSWW